KPSRVAQLDHSRGTGPIPFHPVVDEASLGYERVSPLGPMRIPTQALGGDAQRECAWTHAYQSLRMDSDPYFRPDPCVVAVHDCISHRLLRSARGVGRCLLAPRALDDALLRWPGKPE